VLSRKIIGAIIQSPDEHVERLRKLLPKIANGGNTGQKTLGERQPAQAVSTKTTKEK
jgi:hypothetical protein